MKISVRRLKNTEVKMNAFTYSYPTKVYFGERAAEKNLPAELNKVGKNVMLAYGGGSIKKNGVYDELMSILKAAGKNVTEFSGIMSNPTYKKVQEGAKLAKENAVDFILAVGGGSVIDCCKVISAQAKLSDDLWEFENEKQLDKSQKESEITNILKETDINKLTPLTAFDTLLHLINLAK